LSNLIPLTLIFIASLFFLLASFGINFYQYLYFLSPSENQLYFSSFEETYFVKGEYWRIFTPALMHFSLTHLLFNCLWIYVVGLEIQKLQGRLTLILIVLITGIIANFSEFFLYESIRFGGLSGVVYGLFGFCFAKEIILKQHHFGFPPSLYTFIFIWLLVGYTDILYYLGFGMVANGAHLGGLLSGMLMGIIPSKKRW
jgi:GlpG protein